MYAAPHATQEQCNSAALIKIRAAVIGYCNEYGTSCRYCPMCSSDACILISKLSRGQPIKEDEYPAMIDAFADAVIAAMFPRRDGEA